MEIEIGRERDRELTSGGGGEFGGQGLREVLGVLFRRSSIYKYLQLMSCGRSRRFKPGVNYFSLSDPPRSDPNPLMWSIAI